MPHITRREQIELDELLGDIYRGIETLPDKSQDSSFVTTSSYDIISRGDLRSSGGEPAGSRSSNKSLQQAPTRVIGRAYVREYELPESSPLVQQHKRELAALKQKRGDFQTAEDPYNKSTSSLSQHRSNTRHNVTGGGGGSGTSRLIPAHRNYPQQTNSHQNHENPLGSATPESKRRVRILDPQQSRDKNNADDDEDYALNDDYYNESSTLNQHQERGFERRGQAPTKTKKHRTGQKDKVKYVNTNKFIYHQERNPDDEVLDDFGDENILRQPDSADDEGDDDEDIDGVTRVEYYHTSWLDRQLGRASKRRSSKELNERQVKEKAMIEELKRNLKNGAITLRQSLRGKKNSKTSQKSNDYFIDDQFLNSKLGNKPSLAQHNRNHHHQQQQHSTTKLFGSNKENQIKDSPSKVIRSGLATIPRNYGHQSNSPKQQQRVEQQYLAEYSHNSANTWQTGNRPEQKDSKQPQQKEQYSQFDSVYRTEKPSELYAASGKAFETKPQEQQSKELMQNKPEQTANQYSYTLPNKKSEQNPHQFLKSHYRGTLKDKTNLSSPQPAYMNQSNTNENSVVNKMGYRGYNNNNDNCRLNHQTGKISPTQQQPSSTVSGIPSATEVVRSALSRSGSQASLNQLNKTINLLPNSPPVHSPMTPTQQLKAATPSLSPSPTPAYTCAPNGLRSPSTPNQYSSKTLGHNHQASQHQHLPGQIVLHGTRTVGRPPQSQSTNSTASHYNASPQGHSALTQQQQPVYANPHASLMQHRMEQQMKQPNRNTASIREFNELDSLLRSLSPGSASTTVQTHITPGFSRNPTRPSYGGYMPANQNQVTAPAQTQTYPHQQTGPGSGNQSSVVYAKVQKESQPGAVGSNQQAFTIDVTDKKFDENCRSRQNEELSEFEPSIELVPSMEDYQNISKLNPVRNHYWYKPNMSRDRAISLLKDKPQGTFVVRDSNSFKGAYGLAVKVSKLPKNVLTSLRNSNNDPSAEFIRHFLIEPTGSGVRLKGYANEPVFDSLPDLIYQHSLTELALPCKLIIPRADIENPRFNQIQKQFFDEFIASKEQARHLPYERTSPDGGYRRYPGDVYVHNEHRIIFQ